MRLGSPSGVGNVSATLTLLNGTVYPGNVFPVNGVDPLAVSLDAAAHRLYVANYGPASGFPSVSVIDTTSGTVVQSTPHPTSRPYAILVDPKHDRLYVANYFTSNVSILNATTLAGVSSVFVGSGPNGFALDPAFNRVYVTTVNSPNVTILNASTGAAEGTIGGIFNGFGATVDTARERLFVASNLHNLLYVINTSTEQILHTIPVGGEPQYPTFEPSVDRVFVPNYVNSNVSVINATSESIAATLNGIEGPEDACWDPVGQRLVVSSGDLAAVTIVSLNGTGKTVVPAGEEPAGCTYDPLNQVVVVANAGSLNLTRVSTVPPTLHPAYFVGTAPTSGEVAPGTNYLSVADSASGLVRFFAPPALASRGSVTAPGHPAALAYDPQGDLYVADPRSGLVTRFVGSTSSSLYVGPGADALLFIGPSDLLVALAQANQVALVNTSTWAVAQRLAVGLQPTALAFDPLRGEIAVANFGSNNVTFLRGPPLTRVADVPAGMGPAAVAYVPTSATFLVGNALSRNLTLVDAASLRGTGSAPTIGSPSAIAVDPTTGDPVVLAADLSTFTELYWSNLSTRNSYPVGSQPQGLSYDSADGLWFTYNQASGSVSVLPQPLGGPRPLFEVHVATSPAGCGTITVNGTNLGSAGDLALPAGTYPVEASACTNSSFVGWATSPLLSTGGNSSASTTLDVVGAGSLTASTAPLPQYRLTLEVLPSECGTVGIAGSNHTNGTVLTLRQGVYPVVANGCAGQVFGGWTASGGAAFSAGTTATNGTLNLTGNGTLGVTWNPPGSSGSFAAYATYVYIGVPLAIAALAAGVFLWSRRRPKEPEPEPEPVYPDMKEP